MISSHSHQLGTEVEPEATTEVLSTKAGLISFFYHSQFAACGQARVRGERRDGQLSTKYQLDPSVAVQGN